MHDFSVMDADERKQRFRLGQNSKKFLENSQNQAAGPY